MQRAVVRAMPWVFVLIWSTGFVVARLGMPHAPPFSFLTVRFALSAVCFFVWIALARAAWPASRAQWGHLAVTGVLMQAGYLGGVWSAVKAGIGAGTVALLVGLQPVLTALWVTATASRTAPRQCRRFDRGVGAAVARPAARPRRAGARRLAEDGHRRGDAREPGDGARRPARHHHRHALPEAPRRALRRAHRQRDSDARGAGDQCAVRPARARGHGLACQPGGGDGLVGAAC